MAIRGHWGRVWWALLLLSEIQEPNKYQKRVNGAKKQIHAVRQQKLLILET